MLVPSGGIVVLTAVAFGVLGDVVRDASSDRSSTTGVLSWRRMRTKVRTLSTVATATPSAVRNGSSETAVPLLSVRGLCVALPSPDGPVTIVDNVDLEVHKGEIVGLVGESGCGKTMAISALMRLLPAGGVLSARELRFGGVDLLPLGEKEMSAVRGKRIGFISQEPIGGLDPAYTVAAQLRECIQHHHSATRREANARAVELLRSVGLPEPETVMVKYPHELSGGMAQRVSIARTLAGEPELLIADEPTTALDVTVQAGILDLLRDICRERWMAMILVTHDWGVVADLCSRAIVMYAGQVTESAPILDLFDSPRHPYTAALLAADPGAHPRGTRLPAIAGTVVAPGHWPQGCRFADRCLRATADCSAAPIPLTSEVSTDFRCIHPLPAPVREVAHVG
jgi:peptide/nickel transport system permease protein